MDRSSSSPRGGISRWALAISMFVVAVIVSGVAVDWLPARDGTYSYLKLFNETLLLVRNNYVEEVEARKLMRGAYEGLLATLDPQTEYLTREQYARLTGKRTGDDGDVGIDLSRRGGYLYVVSSLPGSPAEQAGLTSGARLRRIAGGSTREMTLSEARLLLRGKVGTIIEVQRFSRSGEQVVIPLTRTRPQPVRPEVAEQQGAVVLRLASLGPGAADGVRSALKGQKDAELPLLLDLRGNSTGSYEEAASLASLFLSGGEVGRIRSRAGEERVLTARRGTLIDERRIGVLVDAGTAGPAELLTQALRLRADALILGNRTFGRGTLQDYVPLNDGGYLRLSVARCVDVEGVAWDGHGLTPDRELQIAADETATGDVLLRQALDVLAEIEESPAA